MHIQNSPQNVYSQGGISPLCRQHAWSQPDGNMQGDTPVESTHQKWSHVQPQSDCSLPMNAEPRMQMACRVDLMTVEQTAAWVRTLGYFKGWDEAVEYESSFRNNQIKGYLLQSLTLDSLKSDLGIWKYGHRLEIMNAIKSLFPSMGEISSNMAKSVSSTPMYNPMVSSDMGSGNLSFYSPVMTFGTSQNGPQPMAMYYSPNVRCDMVGKRNQSPNRNFVQCMEMVSDFGIQAKKDHITMTEKPSRHHCSTDIEKIPSSKGIPSYINTYENDLNKVAKREKKKSKRAGPSNPVEYMTLCEVQIRAGKSATSMVVGELNAGRTVVINQIKGRSGRVVEKDQNGKYVKKGWVSLFTASGRQLLVKSNINISDVQQIDEQQDTGKTTE